MGKGRTRRAAAEAEEAMRPRRMSRAVGRAVASAMVANGGVHRRTPWWWRWRRTAERLIWDAKDGLKRRRASVVTLLGIPESREAVMRGVLEWAGVSFSPASCELPAAECSKANFRKVAVDP